MRGSGALLGSKKVLVYEFVTGGGWAGRDLPSSLVTEGNAMRRAIVEDFAAVPGVKVVEALDPRVTSNPPRGVEVFPVEPGDERAILKRSAEVDYTVLIAPETDGLLAKLTRSIADAGGCAIGSSPEAVELTADKARLAAHFEARGIPTPPTLIFDTSIGLPRDRGGPVVIKPIDGAGSIDTFVARDTRYLPTGLEPARKMLVQSYLEGIPSGACFLVDRDGRALMVAVGRQRIEVDREGRVRYLGGTIGGSIMSGLSAVERAVSSVPGLKGFVGVDFLDDLDSGPTVLEINPRPTTSYVGLSRMYPLGTIAGAWLDLARGRLAATDWPDRLRRSRRASAVTFRADGMIESEESSR